MTAPRPQESPQPPEPADEDSGVHTLTKREARLLIEASAKKRGIGPAKMLVVGAIAAVGSTGGAIVFLLAFAGESRAQAVVAAQAIAVVQGQRIDVVKGDVDVVKARLEAVDAGVTAKMQQLEEKVEKAARRSEERSDEQEKLLRQLLVEVKKR